MQVTGFMKSVFRKISPCLRIFSSKVDDIIIQQNVSLLFSSIFLSSYWDSSLLFLFFIFLFVFALFQQMECCASYFQLSSQCLEMTRNNVCQFWYTIWPRSFTKHSPKFLPHRVPQRWKKICLWPGCIILDFKWIKNFHIQPSYSVNKLNTLSYHTSQARLGGSSSPVGRMHSLRGRCCHKSLHQNHTRVPFHCHNLAGYLILDKHMWCCHW